MGAASHRWTEAAHLFFAWVMTGMYDGKSSVNSHGPASSVASGCSSFA